MVKDLTKISTEDLCAEIIRRHENIAGEWQNIDEAFYALGYAVVIESMPQEEEDEGG